MRIEREDEGRDVTQNYAEVAPVQITCVQATPEPTITIAPTQTAQLSTETDFALSETERIGNVLYDEYLGTGEGLSELDIAYDGEYLRRGICASARVL